jgi:hypothetical protein
MKASDPIVQPASTTCRPPRNCRAGPGYDRREACHQWVILVPDVEMGQKNRACCERDVTFKHHRRREVDEHVVSDEAVCTNPQRTKPAAIDVDKCEAMENLHWRPRSPRTMAP